MPKKFYITTSIAYVNARPHLGFALELVQTDVIARYHRFLGEEVFFLTGTDENAQKNVLVAEEEKISVQEFIDKNAAIFKKLTKILNISNDDFIRTSDKKKHWPGVRKIWQECKKRGDIYKKKYEGLYCVGCEAFLRKKDLKNGLCPFHLKKPEKIIEENYFFKLSDYQKELAEIVEKKKIKILPEFKKKEILNFINSGLEDLSISRPTERLRGWGISVPGDETQKIYVWFDALTNYISALGYGRKNDEKFKRFWPADLHLIGKDILKFHTVYWPAFLISAGLELPKAVLVHGFITSGGQKMSKSLGNVIDPFELTKKYGVDALRYYLFRESSPFEDLDFTFEKFEKRYNSDLADGLGNLVARIITLTAKLKIKDLRFKIKDSRLNKEIEKTGKNWRKALGNFKFNEALISIWDLIGFCDRYIEKERPWEESENQKEVISNLLFTIGEIAKLLEPFLPETSEKIGEQIKTKKTKPLFPRIK